VEEERKKEMTLLLSENVEKGHAPLEKKKRFVVVLHRNLL